MRAVEFAPGLWRSPLPLAREIASFTVLGGRTVVDLTRRERPTIARACTRHGLTYLKIPTGYDFTGWGALADRVLAAEGPVLVYCYHGRTRTGRTVEAVLARVQAA
jgi:hypothetical protein